MNTLIFIFLIVIIQTPDGEIDVSIAPMESQGICEEVSKSIAFDFWKLERSAVGYIDNSIDYALLTNGGSNTLLYSGCNKSLPVPQSRTK